MSDKRINPRFGPLVIKTRFTVNGLGREGYLTNVSAGGAFLAVEDPPPLGAEVDFVTLLPWRLGELRAGARVVWRSEGRGIQPPHLAGVGLSFTRLDSRAKELLEGYLARFVELAAQISEAEEDEH
jgi:Tfp pilus assembly protein PilZ